MRYSVNYKRFIKANIVKVCHIGFKNLTNMTHFGIASVFGAAEAVDDNHEEADQRKDEAEVYGGEVSNSAAVDDACLNRGKHRTAEDRHDQTGGAELGVIAETLQCDTVDGREHQRHTCRYTHEAIDAHTVLEDDYSRGQCCGGNGEDRQKTTGVHITQQIGADEARAAEYQHRYDVVTL